MLASRPILVPLDGSPLSERSLPYAAALARALGSPLRLMIAAYISDIPAHGPWSEEMVNHPQETSMAYLAGARERLGDANAELVVKIGYPHEMILEAAGESEAGLIVLSTHGRSGFSRWAYGSTAGHLLHSSRVPLLVIGQNVAPADAFAPKQVLVPLDGSALGEAALPYATELSSAFGAQITLLRVAPTSVESFPMTVPQVYWPNLDEELVNGARAYLEKVRSQLGQPVEIKVVQGPRADALLSAIEDGGIDLAVMTTHGRAGIQRAILGSTADRMLEGTAPVLLIRPD